MRIILPTIFDLVRASCTMLSGSGLCLIKNGRLGSVVSGRNFTLASSLKFFVNSRSYIGRSNFIPKSRSDRFESGLLRNLNASKIFRKQYHRWYVEFLKYYKSGGNDTWKNYNRYYGRNRWNKLIGPGIFTGIFCVATSFLVPHLFEYAPFKYLKRNPQVLIYSLIGVNGLVFLMWKSPYCTRFLNSYGLLLKEKAQSNWAMLTSAFSHQEFFHLLVNMFVLQSFGIPLCASIGAANFAVMYLNSAVLSSFASLLIPILARTATGYASLGASGAVFSIFGAFSYLFPKAAVAFFFIPIPGGAWVLFLGSLIWNVAGVALRWGRYDYAAHIGGCLAGIYYGWQFDKKRQERIRSLRSRYAY